MKSCISSSTLDGSFVPGAGRDGSVGFGRPDDASSLFLDPPRPSSDEKKEKVELGIVPVLRDAARSLSTAAFTL